MPEKDSERLKRLQETARKAMVDFQRECFRQGSSTEDPSVLAACLAQSNSVLHELDKLAQIPNLPGVAARRPQ